MKNYLMLFRQAVFYRKNLGSLWLFFALLSTPLIFIVFRSGRWPLAIAMGLGVPSLILIILWWIFYLKNAMLQNSPINAHLVPALRKRLIIASFTAWIGVSIALAAIGAIGTGHFIQCWVLVSLFFLMPSIIMRSFWVGVPLLYFFQLRRAFSDTLWISEMSAMMKIAVTALILLVGAGIFNWIFRKGGDAHWRRHMRIRRFQPSSIDGSPRLAPSEFNRATSFFSRLTASGYQRTFNPSARYTLDPGKLTCYALGPDFHWSSNVLAQSIGIGILVNIAGILSITLWFGAGSNLAKIVAAGTMYTILISPLLFAGKHVLSVYKTRNEQSLLRLAPNALQDRAINRTIARTSLIYFGITWTISTGIAVALPMLSMHSLMDTSVPVVISLNLFIAVFLVRDYARTPQPSYFWHITGSFLMGCVLVAWTFLQPSIRIHTGILFAACLTCSAALTRYRWKKAMAAPVAFPAGRLVL